MGLLRLALIAALLLLPSFSWAQGSPIIQPPITTGNCAVWTSGYKIGSAGSACGLGTMTSITAGTGLTGGTITVSGTIALDTTRVFTAANTGLVPASGGGILKYLRADGTWQTVVTGVTAGSGLTGGTISTTGTLALDPTFLFTSVATGLVPASGGGTASFLRADASWVTAVQSVNVSGGTTGLTFGGGPVTGSGTITAAGTLAVANGGTGSATQNFVDLTTTQNVAGAKTFTTQLIGAGTATNDSAAVGYIGEYTSATGSGVSLTTTVVTDLASRSLTAGDWTVCANATFIAGAADAPTSLAAWISTTTATDPGAPNGGAYVEEQLTFGTASTNVLPVGCMRVSLAAPGTAYLTAAATHAGGTLTGGGAIWARRPR